MNCDELKYYCAYRGEVIDKNCDEYKDNPKYDTFYMKADVDEAIEELKAKVKFCSDFELAARKDIEEMRGQHQMLKQFGHYKLSPVPGKMINHEVRQYVSYNVVCMIIKHLESENADLKAKLEDVNELIKTARQMLEDAKATHYAEMVDAGMRERRLKRALYIVLARSFCCMRELAARNALYDDECKWDNFKTTCLKKAEEYK